jgi:hypothetical protein
VATRPPAPLRNLCTPAAIRATPECSLGGCEPTRTPLRQNGMGVCQARRRIIVVVPPGA